jgi:hypothetical protein
MSVAACLVIDYLLASRQGRLSVHLIVFFMSEAPYILRYCAEHFGWSFAPSVAAVACALCVGWELLRRWVFKPPPPRFVFITGALGALLASFGLPTLPVYAGDQQATLAGDLLTEVLRPVVKAAGPSKHTVTVKNATSSVTRLPHIVMFHIEAARPDVLSNHTTPFLANLLRADSARLHPVFATVPMTLKSAWELLCGTIPSLSADYREHQHEEFRSYCLPRILRGLGYRTVCAKTDPDHSQIPQVVLGFDDVITEEDPKRLIDRVDRWLVTNASRDQLVFIYFYYSGSHSPYNVEQLQNRRQYPAVVQQFHEEEWWNTYMNMVHRADRCAEHFRKMLESRNICSSESLWLIFGDHSESLPGDVEGPLQWQKFYMRGASVRLDFVHTFAVVQHPTWTKLGESSIAPRQFADFYATVLDAIGLKAQGPIFLGVPLNQLGPPSRTTYSYMWLDSTQCAKRRQGVTQLLHRNGIELYNTEMDPSETTAVHIAKNSSLEADCFDNLFVVNDHYRQGIPNARRDFQSAVRTRLLLRSALDVHLNVSSQEPDGTRRFQGVLAPFGEAVFANARGLWVASDRNGQRQFFNAFDSFVIIDLHGQIPHAPRFHGENVQPSCGFH